MADDSSSLTPHIAGIIGVLFMLGAPGYLMKECNKIEAQEKANSEATFRQSALKACQENSDNVHTGPFCRCLVNTILGNYPEKVKQIDPADNSALRHLETFVTSSDVHQCERDNPNR